MSVPYSEGKNRVTLEVSEAHLILIRVLDETARQNPKKIKNKIK